MPPKPGTAFYAVKKGHNPGVYLSWPECNDQTKSFPGAKYKKFLSKAQAEDYVQGIEPAPEQNNGNASASSSNVRVEEPGWDVVYSDGACKGNGKVGSVAGVGVWWGPNDPRNIAERCPGDQTNNRAELIAILRVLEETPISKKPLRIKTDSQYSKNCFERWIGGWKRNGWRNSSKEPVKNAGIISLIDAHLIRRRDKFGQVVEFAYVKGHSGDIGNDGADAQANMGALLPAIPERDWAQAEAALQQEPLPEIAEDLSATRKRSRSPKQRYEDAARIPVVVPPKMPSGSKAERLVAIEEALKSPLLEFDGPPKWKRVKTPPRDGAYAAESSRLRNESPAAAGRAPPQSSTSSPKKQSRIALLEAALAGEIEPPPVSFNAPIRQFSSSATTNSADRRVTSKYSESSHATELNPVRVIYALPPLVPVQKDEIDVDDYADCLLSDDDLLNEL